MRRGYTVVGLALLAAPALAGGPATRQWILATAKATGAGGERFVSSLRIVNPGEAEAKVTLAYLAQSPFNEEFAATGDNTNPPLVDFVVPAGQMLPIEDVVGTHFNSAAPFGVVAGGLVVTSSQPVSVLSRTYVANATNASGVAGIYGFSIPAQPVDEAIGLGDTGFIPYIAAAPGRASGFRCNLMFLNTVPSTTVAQVALKRKDGTLIGQRDYTLGKLAAGQQGDIAASFGYSGPDEELFVAVTVKSGGPIVVGASIIDNAISSLNYAPPSKTMGGAAGLRNGVYAIVFRNAQDPYGMTARADIADGAVQYLAFSAVPDGCPSSYWFQATPASSGGNTTFTRQPNGSTIFSGANTGWSPGTWSGAIRFTAEGIAGDLTFGRPAHASTCPNRSVRYDFVGTWAASLDY